LMSQVFSCQQSVETRGRKTVVHWTRESIADQLKTLNLKTILLIDATLTQQLEIAQHLARAEHDRRQRIVGDGHRQARFLTDALVEIFQQRATARQDDAAIADIG